MHISFFNIFCFVYFDSKAIYKFLAKRIYLILDSYLYANMIIQISISICRSRRRKSPIDIVNFGNNKFSRIYIFISSLNVLFYYIYLYISF